MNQTGHREAHHGIHDVLRGFQAGMLVEADVHLQIRLRIRELDDRDPCSWDDFQERRLQAFLQTTGELPHVILTLGAEQHHVDV